jgi:hypothetical protein
VYCSIAACLPGHTALGCNHTRLALLSLARSQARSHHTPFYADCCGDLPPSYFFSSRIRTMLTAATTSRAPVLPSRATVRPSAGRRALAVRAEAAKKVCVVLCVCVCE